MNADIITTCVIAVFLVILLVGFIFGLARGFNKSLIRILMVVATLVIAFFVTPTITKALMKADISNMNLTINGENITSVTDIVVSLLDQIPELADIAGTDAYANIINIVPQMLINVVLFLVVFLLLRLITMIIYWIIAGICFNKKKTEGKNKHRLLGSLVGAVQNFIIFLAILVPVIGTVNILGDIETITTQTEQEQTSSEGTTLASSEQSPEEDSSVDSGESDEDNQISPYQTIKDIRMAYNNSWVAKFMHSVKLDNACMYVFDELSTVTITTDGGEEEYNLRAETKSFAYIIIDFQDLQELGELDFSNPETVIALNNLIDSCYKSNLTANLIDEAIPIATAKWINDETFCGFSRPKVDGYDNIITDLLTQLGSSQDVQEALKNTVKLAGNIIGKASDIIDADGNIDLDKVGELLTSLGEDQSSLEFVQDILTEDNITTIVDKLLPPTQGDNGENVYDDYNLIIKETLNTVIGADYGEESGNNFANEVDVITNTLKGVEKLTDSEAEFKQEDANEIINSLSESTVIMDTISQEGSDINKKITEELNKEGNEEAKEMVETAIKNLDDDNANKQKLAEMFGIDLSQLPTQDAE